MLTKTPHLFDDATRVSAGDSRWQGRTSEDYWAFVGPFGGATAATILRALIGMFQKNFAKFESQVDPEVRAAAPEVKLAAE